MIKKIKKLSRKLLLKFYYYHPTTTLSSCDIKEKYLNTLALNSRGFFTIAQNDNRVILNRVKVLYTMKLKAGDSLLHSE
ncbi:hypothetical protein CWD77_03920 [Rhodohalobacter barkolensis]|uniref:Uncharacterized protein n=1 Tax=Rhodohalobacter barkolensis TaxID=2053187 RepID=A0A2N0VKB3_9BACT|nr:hypothetical protein CWD77_03920 [Rhodohalobacter barkolensis]